MSDWKEAVESLNKTTPASTNLLDTLEVATWEEVGSFEWKEEDFRFAGVVFRAEDSSWSVALCLSEGEGLARDFRIWVSDTLWGVALSGAQALEKDEVSAERCMRMACEILRVSDLLHYPHQYPGEVVLANSSIALTSSGMASLGCGLTEQAKSFERVSASVLGDLCCDAGQQMIAMGVGLKKSQPRTPSPDDEWERETCLTCEGEGWVGADGHMVECPMCDGTGEVS